MKDYTCKDHPNEYDELRDDMKAALAAWIANRIVSARTVYKASSYGLKHQFASQMRQERPIANEDYYVSNGEFKGAMLAAGYEPTNPADQNWLYRIKPAYPKALG
jgi:hypothetical protein